ncbi:MAG: alpha-2-macroglobulin family protein [Janthinobacterium lividum]
MRIVLIVCGLLLSIFLADSAVPGPTPPLAAQWKKIDALLRKDQTATAAPLVERIYQQARQENNTPAYVRALLYKVRLLSRKEQDADEKAIALLEADLQTAQFPARPILHSLLASLYTQYYDQHRGQLYERTAGAAATTDPATPGHADGGTSLATWDAHRLGATIVRHYYRSVEDEPERQLAVSLAALGDLAVRGDAEGQVLRPSLYDLLAQRAIAGLQNQELYITKPEQQFSLSAYPAATLFGPAAGFASLRLLEVGADTLNHELHTLHLLQHLTGRRLSQPQNQAALADVDLQRLNYLHELAKDTDADQQYAPALERLADTYRALPSSAEFLVQLASWQHEKDHDVLARQTAREAEARYPKSRGAARARVLRTEIEQREVSFSAAEIVVPGRPWPLAAKARNLTALHAWAYRISLAEWQKFHDYDGNRSLARRYARALQAAPAATWTVPVPPGPADYRERQLTAQGAALPVGYYLVLLSSQASRPAAPAPGQVTAYGVLGASELSVLTRDDPATGAWRTLVLHRQSGAPLARVRVQASYTSYRTRQAGQTLQMPAVLTDASGQAPPLVPNRASSEGRRLIGSETIDAVRVWRGADTLKLPGSGHYIYNNTDLDGRQDHPVRGTFMFTDRAIYRPGQTLYFKGIEAERRASKNRILPGEPVSVRLLDVNGQTVQTLTFTTSEFGSFNGSLVLPTGLLSGQMSLRTDYGGAGFTVEDYKRPTFAVTLDSVAGRPQLGQPVLVPGRALAYAGQATDGASVSYHITRRELWPLYRYDYERSGDDLPGRTTQEVAHGTATTDAEGRFAVTFTPARETRQPGWEPGYVFEVTADVTDAAGETHSATRKVVVGHNSLSLALNGPDEADKQDLAGSFTLLSTNATGEPLPATGTLRLLALDAPAAPGDSARPRLLQTLPFDTKAGPALDLAAVLRALPTGRYRLEAQATPPDSARARHDFILYDSQADRVPYATPDWFVALQQTVEPGQPTTILLGSSEANARILLEVERGGQLLRQEWLTLRAGEQRRLTLASSPAEAREPLYIHTTQVRDNQLYRHDATVEIAEKPQPLRLDLATFRDKLQPGAKETWRITIHQANGQPADAELLATLYDQSLDVFRPHSFQPLAFDAGDYPAVLGWLGEFETVESENIDNAPFGYVLPVFYPMLFTWGVAGDDEYYGNIPPPGPGQGRAYGVRTVTKGLEAAADYEASAPAPAPPAVRAIKFTPPIVEKDDRITNTTGAVRGLTYSWSPAKNLSSAPAPDLSAITARADFRETALWQPALRTDANGDMVLEFQMPEAVTRWQLLALAHDQQLHSGDLARRLVTQKEIQLTPNAPRFLRQGDTFTFPAKFSNLTDHTTSGTAQLLLLDAATGQDITSQLLTGPAQQAVAAAAHGSVALGWEVRLPSSFAPVAVTYKVVAQTGSGKTLDVRPETLDPKSSKRASKRNAQTAMQAAANNQQPTTNNEQATYSDGEENTLPVLTNRILITESLPLPIVGAGTRSFELRKLTSTTSPTRQNYSLTLEMTTNPAWYAVQSLPYLMEYPYECSEQTFSRLYANLLAAQILKSNPRFKTVLAEWTRQAQSGTSAQRNQLASKLEQNQELKNILLQETPWVRDAQGENERLARLSTLFDETRLHAETARALLKLQRMQLGSGAFPWFEKMPADRYITHLIVAGFGKLRKLGAFDASQDAVAQGILQKSLRYLDQELAQDYTDLRKQKNVQLADDHLGDDELQALYARSFWPQPLAADARAAYGYYRGQAATYWLHRTRYLQAQLALVLHRDNKTAPATQLIMRALSENALHSPELGMYWQDVQHGYYWREAPTETQATLIEAYDEINHDQQAVDELKLWLLQQKHTQHWESTRATADACYALLLRGSDWLAPTQPLQVSVGGQPVRPETSQAGTGYTKTSWLAAEIQPAQGKVTVTKADAGVAWGALYWQYFEDLDKVTTSAAALSVERQLYRETRTAAGPQFERLTASTPLRVGDALVVRLVLRTDRALEYVHLKDQRAAGLELIGQLSGYQYQGGLGYYESPRDAATHFFFGAVPRGTHVLEYRLRASQAGDFSGGLSQVQCLYAPEFGATSAGQRLTIAR